MTATFSTAQLAAWDREFLWHPFTPMKAWVENKDIIVIDRGQGEWLIDTEGRRYIDGTSSIWCNVHGHGVPELDAALREQLDKIAHTSLLGLASPPSILLGRKLVSLMRACGLALDKVFYSDDGSTAVEVACKMAYQYWRNLEKPGARSQKPVGGRSRFVALTEAYHGDTLGAVSVGGIGAFHETFRGLCFPADFVAPPRRVEELAGFAARLDQMLGQRPTDYAAVIVEPVIQGAGGMIVHAPGTLRAVRELCDRHQVLLIADEVMTGFGRIGRWFACEHEAVSPDLMCLSKGLTGGYMPLGVTMASQRIYDAFYADPREGKTFYHGHTFTGHPLACAVALRSIELMEQRQLVERAQALGAIMAEELRPLRGCKHVRDLRQVGLIAAVEVGDEQGNAYPFHWRIGGALCTQMRAHGVMLRPLGDVLVVMPPLAIGEENLRKLCRAVVESVGWVPDVVAAKRREFGD